VIVATGKTLSRDYKHVKRPPRARTTSTAGSGSQPDSPSASWSRSACTCTVRIGPIATVEELEAVRAKLAEAEVDAMPVTAVAIPPR